VQIFWKVDFLGEFWSFFTCKISYLRYQTQKNLKVAVHFHICVLQQPAKCEAEVMRIKKVIAMIQKFLTSVRKLKKRCKQFSKTFWKVSTFCYWLYFCVVPMLHSEIQYQQHRQRSVGLFSQGTNFAVITASAKALMGLYLSKQ